MLPPLTYATLALPKGEEKKDEQSEEMTQADNTALIERFKTRLGERVTDVRTTERLVDSPACLVSDEYDLGGNLARILKAAGRTAPASKPILEINPKHPVVLRLRYEEKKFDDWAAVLFDQALLAEGGQLEDPAAFVRRVNALMLEMGSK